MAINNGKISVLCAWVATYGNHGESHEQYMIYPVIAKHAHVNIFPLDTISQKDVELIDTVCINKPDVLLIRLYGKTICPATISYITHQTNTFTVGLFGDDEKYFDSGECASVKYAPCFDMVATTWINAVDKYKSICINPYVMSHGANADFMKRTNCKKDIEVSFVGQARENRISFLNNLLNNGITKMKVFGHGWTKENPVLTHKQYPNIIARSKINLNISEDIVNKVKVQQVKARDFEVPMCGGFLLTGQNDDIEYYYTVGEEIETYSTHEECADKIKYYLKHSEKRERIAQKGYERARKNYSYQLIYGALIENIKLNLPKRLVP
jgi:spore maturation protein CgeB